MKTTISRIILFLKTFILLVGCATYNPHYEDKEQNWKPEVEDRNLSMHRIYFIGDAGGAEYEKGLSHFDHLKEKLEQEDENSTLVFLGDNIYKNGMPAANSSDRELAEYRINSQLELAANFKGRLIFMPGNHDYYNDGIIGLKRQEDFIRKQTNQKNIFLPENGCPLEKIDLNDETVLLLIDSQWYLDNWDKNPTKNDDCEIKTRSQFFEAYGGLVKKNAMKTIIVAIHHPMFSSGPHGGQFKFSLINSIPNLLRKTSGASVQDQQNALFRNFKDQLMTLSQSAERLVLVSGHDHLLQYVERDGIPQIISGSGSKISASRGTNGSEFSWGTLGYARLDLLPNQESKIKFYKAEGKTDSLVYAKQIFDQRVDKKNEDYNDKLPEYVNASVYSKEEVQKGSAYRWLWGEHYRKYYGQMIKVKTIRLDTFKGGLKPVRRGGGHQSNSLRLVNSEGQEYVMRALRKNPLRFMQTSIFLDQHIEGKYDDTFAEGLLYDVFTASHPYAPLTIGPLMEAADILHPNSELYYVPKQSALLEFNKDYGDELYFIEERAASGHGDKANFGYSNEIISTDDMMEELRKSDDNFVDEPSYIRARLLDMIIGDWDRHKDQWRWAVFKDGKKKMFRPVPRDRDQAFSKYDGFLMETSSKIIAGAKKLQVYDEDFRSLKWFNYNPLPIDKTLIARSDLNEWLIQADSLKQNLTEEVLDTGLSKMPVEVQDETIEWIKSVLKSRIRNIDKTAMEYYAYLNKYPVIKGNDKDNYFKIERLSKGKTRVGIYNIKNEELGSKIFEKEYDLAETKEVWIYGLDDNDVFKVFGDSGNNILLRLIGGQNKDTYDVENGRKVVIYDFKDKENEFTTNKGKVKLSNDYETNLFDYKKHKYSLNQLMPTLGFNPDDGFRLGINNILTVYGFKRDPFTTQHVLTANYYFATNGFDIAYRFEAANVFKNWNVLVQTGATSPNYSINYYGFGNETTNEEETEGADYHRVRTSAYVAYPKLKWYGRFGAELELGALFEGIELENTEGRFISTIPDLQEDRQYYWGAQGKYTYENYDNASFPTLGMGFELEGGWKTNTNGNFDDLLYLIPVLNLDHRLTADGKLVFATKFKGHLTWGDNIEFYNAASIGGKNGLRGYRNQRFTGNKSYYQNTDIRYNIKEVKTGLMPLEMVVFGGFDYGRVWVNDENSNDWKTSFGGGFGLVGAQMMNLNLSLFGSEDGAYFAFGLGFDF